MSRSLMEILDPNGFNETFNRVRTGGLIRRPDALDVIFLSNEAIDDVRDSVVLAEDVGLLPRLDY